MQFKFRPKSKGPKSFKAQPTAQLLVPLPLLLPKQLLFLSTRMQAKGESDRMVSSN
jgi:hypothetical protein